MRKFGSYFSYCMGIGLIAPIIGGFPIGDYSRFLLTIAGGSLVLAFIFALLDKQTDKLLRSLSGEKQRSS